MLNKKKAVAVVLAAGKGTRMKSEHPKVAVQLNGKPLVSHVIENIRKSGIDEIVVVVGYKKEEVREICSVYPNIKYAEQTEQLGTGHALLCTEEQIGSFDGSVLVACGDVPMISSATFGDLLDYHTQQNYKATILSSVVSEPKGYGRIIRNEDGDVVAIVEEKDADLREKSIKEINTGTYIFDSSKLFEMLRKIGTENAQGEYYLPDLIKMYRNQGWKLGAMKLKNHMESLGINSQEDLATVSDLINQGVIAR